MQAIERDQHAGVFQRLVVFHHRRYALGIGRGARRCGLIALWDHQHHESYGRFPGLRVAVITGRASSREPGMTRVLRLRALGAKTVLLLAQFGCQRLAKILGIEDLANFDLGAAVERRALHPFDGLVPRLHLNQPEPGNEIAGHGERAVADATLLAGIFERAPFEVGCRPSPASMTPAFTISSLNLPIAVSNSVLGITPASLFLSAFTITMNRIASLRLTNSPVRRLIAEPSPINKTSRVLRHRHVQ